MKRAIVGVALIVPLIAWIERVAPSTAPASGAAGRDQLCEMDSSKNQGNVTPRPARD